FPWGGDGFLDPMVILVNTDRGASPTESKSPSEAPELGFADGHVIRIGVRYVGSDDGHGCSYQGALVQFSVHPGHGCRTILRRCQRPFEPGCSWSLLDRAALCLG